MTELEALVALNMAGGIGPATVRRLLERFGSATAALGAPAEALRRVEGIGPEGAALVRRAREEDAAGEIRKAAGAGAAVISIPDEAYPEPLRQIHDPPPVLYVLGKLSPAAARIAVVGARRATPYGAACAERLARHLAAVGLTVVSGLARGIDTAAHRGALKGGGRTIAVLGGGLGRLYPPENRSLAAEIAASGAVVSEFPMETPPHGRNFPLRNRVISGLSLGVLVVEAARRSGALITAAQALEQGRSVFAVPGRIDSPLSRGTHALIRDGARLVESVEDILEEFPYLFPRPGRPEGGEAAPRMPALPPDEDAVLKCLSMEGRPIDEIIATTGLPAPAVSAALLSLEIKRLAVQLPGKVFRRTC
ncbi:MAG: DNA-processing protein DprA [bacterium]|nr:DNA-processing protein DprA [bacterium]